MSTIGSTQISYSQSCFNEMIKATTNTHLSGHREGISGALLTVYTAVSCKIQSLNWSSPAELVTTVLSVHGTSLIKSASLQHSSTSVCETRMSVSPPSGKERISQVIKEKKKNTNHQEFTIQFFSPFDANVFLYKCFLLSNTV